MICAELCYEPDSLPCLRISSTFSSLVHPRTAMAASEIHAITVEDVRDAPSFRELASTLAELLEGRVLVSHNIAFDLAFLREEFAHSGYELHASAQDCVCTMLGSWVYLDIDRHTLSEVARAVGSPLREHHRALTDAQGAMAAFEYFLLLEQATPGAYSSVHTRRGQYARRASWSHAQPVHLEAASHEAQGTC